MPQPLQSKLSRRERQIMDALFRLGDATAHDVQRELANETSYDSVRVTLNILEKKGFVRHRQDGQRNVYRPTISRDVATRSAVRHLLRTFFEGQPSKAILTLLDLPSTRPSPAELDEIQAWIEQARKEH